MNTGKGLRFRRIWRHRRAVIVPFDHGQYGGVPSGLEDPARLTAEVASTDADAILVTPSVLGRIAGELGHLSVVLRLDGAFTKYTPVTGDYEPISSPEQAVRMGADAGIVFTFVGTDFDASSLRRLGATAEEASKWGLPLVSEILPPSLLNNHFEREGFHVRLENESLEDQTISVARIGAEHGADVIKTRYPGSPSALRKVVETCHARLIIAGGPPSHDGSIEGLLRFAADCVQGNAAGIVFGRAVWQRPNVRSVIRALCAIVHEEEPVSRALKLIK